MPKNLSENFNTIFPYFGSINWFANVLQHQQVQFLDSINYNKKWQANKLNLVGAQGIQHLSIPLQGGRNQKIPFKEIKISYAENWQHQHFNTIKSLYGRAPFYEYCEPAFLEFFATNFETLLEANFASFQIINKISGINFEIKTNSETPILLSEYKELSNNIKYQQVFEPKITFANNMSILDLILCTGRQNVQQLRNIKT